METLIYFVVAAAVIGIGVVLVFVARRRREPEEELPRSGMVTGKAQPDPFPILEDHDPAEGTAKIDREDLAALVGGESSVAEQAYFLVIAGEGIGRFIALDRDEYVIGREPGTADLRFRDDAISQRHARVKQEGGAVVIEDLGSSNGTYVDGERVRKSVLKDGSRVVLGRSTVLTLTFQDQLGEQFQRRMYESSTRDTLTGAYNRATFADQMHTELQFAKRHGTNYCLVMFDIDHFKEINDNYGHVAGDDILRGVAEVIRSVTREEALFVRYGGEEFIVGERNADMEIGGHIGERIRGAIESTPFETVAGTLQITVSVGVADLTVAEERTTVALVDAADGALYEAKNGGRNQVRLARREP